MRTLMALREYLDCTQLDHSLPLDYNGTLAYHWSNHDLARRFQKENLKSNPRPRVRFDQLGESLESLKEVPVWLSNNLGQLKIDMYTLYSQFSDPKLRQWMLTVPHMLISTCAQSGPYVPLSSMRWFDSDIYRRFVLRRILTGSFPVREFRLQTNLPAQIIFDELSLHGHMARIHQLTPRGILLGFSNPMIVQELREKRGFNLNLSWGQLVDLNRFAGPHLLDDLRQQNLRPQFSGSYRVRLAQHMRPELSSSQHNEHILFVPFDCMIPEDVMVTGEVKKGGDECEQIVRMLTNIKNAVEKTIKLGA